METLDHGLKEFGTAASGILDQWLSMVPMDNAVLSDPGQGAPALAAYTALARDLGQAASVAGLEGLQSVCALVETNLLILEGTDRPLPGDVCARLNALPGLVFDYWASQASPESGAALLENLCAGWPLPFPEEAAGTELVRLTGQHEITPAAPRIEQEAALDDQPEPGSQSVPRSMLAIMREEFGAVADQLGDCLTAADRQASRDEYTELLQRLGVALESIGLTALGCVLARLGQQVGPVISAEAQEVLQELPVRVSAYLDDPLDADACTRLVQLLASPVWQTPMGSDEAARWSRALADVVLTEDDSELDTRPAEATAQDVSLELPDDVNSELLEGLLQELPVHTSAFTAAIERIAGGSGSLNDVERAMRAAHTLKGAANTVGVRGIANLTHHLEDILEALIEAGKLPGKTLADVLVDAADCLEAMSEVLLGIGDAPPQAQQVLQRVLDSANRIDREGVAAADEARSLAPVPESAEPDPEPARGDSGGASPSSPAEHALRVPAAVVDELLRLAGETLISTSQIQEHWRLTSNQAKIIRQQGRLIQQLVAELEELVDIRGIASTQQKARSASEFDALEFEHYSELHTVTHRLVEAATDAQEMADEAGRELEALGEVLEEQRRLQMANQETVLRTRMVAVGSVSARLQRGVRQAARLLDKHVQLTITGEHTQIDGHVLNDLMDPLMHVLRNAVDHGIEAPEVRAAAGKPAQGRIELSFAREGNSIVVRCRDDGAGLDYGAIRRMGERKGLLEAGHDHSPDELARVILAPGFSTRSETSHVSGRGVGMDIVYNRVLELKGLLALDSKEGRGLTVELRLPATLLSTHTLIVRQREKRLAVSTRGVEDIRYVTREQIQEIGPRLFFREGEQLHAVLKLESLLALPGDRRAKDRYGFPVLFTRMADGTLHAVLVQEIIDSREVVMKNFGRYVPRTQGVIGAVILGDGGVAPVIDLVELLRAPRQRAPAEHAPGPAGAQAPDRKPLVALIVDDSLSARRAISQTVKDAGFDVRLAADGMEAASMLQRFVPDIILTDLEMPRMSGLELAAHVRGAERTRNVPLIMITSRSTDKHRQMIAAAGVNVHLTKPFSEDALVRHVMQLTKP